MKTKGIRISDIKNGKCIPLIEILGNIQNGSQIYWTILWMDVTPLQNHGKHLIELEKKINLSKNGLDISFASLISISQNFFQEIAMSIIGDKSKNNLHRYKEDKEMYETCDIVIEMIDGGFWEVFTKDPKLIGTLKEKFNETELLEINFEK